MALSYKTRKRLSLLVLVVGVPLYIVTAVSVMNWIYPDPLDRPSVGIELLIYALLGILWAIPLRAVFKGIGQPDPDAPQGE
ncbi:MAG: DUF2842 domain-containing protein [Pseudomonadota bacterium]